MMRILMLTSSWPAFRGDYRGGFVEELAVDLARRGICVDVAVPASTGPVEHREYEGGRLVVHWLPSVLPVRSAAFHGAGIENNLLKHPLSAFSIAPALMAFAAECSVLMPFVDAVVSNWLLPMGAVGAALCALSGRPHLVIAHSGPPTAALVPPMSSVVRKIVSSASSVACVSGSVLRKTLAVAGEGCADRLKVIPLGVSLRPVVVRQSDVTRPLSLMFVGRLVSIKGLDVLLRAMRGLDGFKLSVVGDGPTRRSMESLADLVGVDTVFCGAVACDEVRQRMCQADILVIPSRRGIFGREEGLPRVIAEAWSVGLPVLASRTGGIGEVVDRTGAGLLFEPGDVTSLRKRLTSLRDDPGILEGLRPKALDAAVCFSWERVGVQWVEWVESALNRGR